MPTQLNESSFHVLDKKYLYTGDFSNSVIIIYESVDFEVCMAKSDSFFFHHKKYYSDFNSYYVDIELKPVNSNVWDNVVLFPEKKKKNIFSIFKKKSVPPKAEPQGTWGN